MVAHENSPSDVLSCPPIDPDKETCATLSVHVLPAVPVGRKLEVELIGASNHRLIASVRCDPVMARSACWVNFVFENHICGS